MLTVVSVLQDKLNLSCVHSPAVAELMRGIRTQMEGLITGLPPREISAMSLGLAHRCGAITFTHYKNACCRLLVAWLTSLRKSTTICHYH